MQFDYRISKIDEENGLITSSNTKRKNSSVVGFPKVLGFSYKDESHHDLAEIEFENDLAKEPHDALELNETDIKQTIISRIVTICCVVSFIIVFILLFATTQYSELADHSNYNCNNLQKPDHCEDAAKYSGIAYILNALMISFLCIFSILLFSRIYIISRLQKQ